MDWPGGRPAAGLHGLVGIRGWHVWPRSRAWLRRSAIRRRRPLVLGIWPVRTANPRRHLGRHHHVRGEILPPRVGALGYGWVSLRAVFARDPAAALCSR